MLIGVDLTWRAEAFDDASCAQTSSRVRDNPNFSPQYRVIADERPKKSAPNLGEHP
jgi:hypothetical protein